jgi:hypothetical protein
MAILNQIVSINAEIMIIYVMGIQVNILGVKVAENNYHYTHSTELSIFIIPLLGSQVLQSLF